MPTALKFKGHRYLRHRLALAILSGKSIQVDGIRSKDKDPGLRDYEASFLRLLDKITNGTHVEISYTGTSLLLHPGVITGGKIVHECPLSRSIGYFLEPIILLAPFCKRSLHLIIKGVTTDEHDLSADLLRTVTLPHLQLFGVGDGLELRIKKRGATPLGGGEIEFLCPNVKTLKIFNFVEGGKVRRIRGIAHAVRVSPQFTNRMIDSARSVLNRYIPDIYIYSDIYKGDEAGKSPGYGLTLVSTSTTDALHASESVSQPGGSPEELGLRAARQLLVEIKKSGCIDSAHQSMVFTLMALGSEDIQKVRSGPLTPKAVQTLRDLKDFFGIAFKIVPAESSDPENEELLMSCFGCGYVNVNRSVA